LPAWVLSDIPVEVLVEVLVEVIRIV